MNVNSINKQALAQIYFILEDFNEDIKVKIPNSLINTIQENMDKNYTNLEILLEETKEILYAILNKYILNDLQREKLAEYYKFYDKKIEEEKIKKYQYKDLFKKNSESIQIEKQINENTSLVVSKKENIIISFFNKIKCIFRRIK